MGITAVILLTFFVNVGFGRHIYCLPASDIPLVFEYSVLAQIFNIAGIGLVKISVCLHILRIVDRARRDISIFLRLLILITFLSHLAQILLFCVQCRPMPAIWNPQQYPNAKCFSSHITYLAGYIGFGLDAFTDLMTAIIPVVVIRALQMNTRTKTALCILMGLGVLTAICAIAKAITLQGVFAADYTWALWRPGLCTIIEHLMGMIIASAPALNPLFKRALRTPTSLYGSNTSHRSDRGEKEEGERQSRRVTRWADARTPPNVHVAHYSPYTVEPKKYYDRNDEESHRHDHQHHYSNSTSGSTSSKPPKTATTTSTSTSTTTSNSSSSNSAPLISSQTVTPPNHHRNEITKTISFRRISEHEPDHDPIILSSERDKGFARGPNGDLISDRLWIGNGYWGLPPAPAGATAAEEKDEGSYSSTLTQTQTQKPMHTHQEEPPLLLSLPPHPAVGRWVRSGAERPEPRDEGRTRRIGGEDLDGGKGEEKEDEETVHGRDSR